MAGEEKKTETSHLLDRPPLIVGARARNRCLKPIGIIGTSFSRRKESDNSPRVLRKRPIPDVSGAAVSHAGYCSRTMQDFRSVTVSADDFRAELSSKMDCDT